MRKAGPASNALSQKVYMSQLRYLHRNNPGNQANSTNCWSIDKLENWYEFEITSCNLEWSANVCVLEE